MAESFYNPKPAKFEANSGRIERWALEIRSSVDAVKTIRYLLDNTAWRLLRVATGLPSAPVEEETNWFNRDKDTNMVRDQWRSRYWCTSSKPYEVKVPLEVGRSLGLWTAHAPSGRAVPFPLKDGDVRINPEAFEWLVRVFIGSGEFLITDYGMASGKHPSWRYIDKGHGIPGTAKFWLAVHDEVLEVKHLRDVMLFRLKDAVRNPYKEIAETLMASRGREWDFLERSHGGHKELFPSVFPDLLTSKCWNPRVEERLKAEALATESALQSTLSNARECRKRLRAFKDIGGSEGLLTAMGKDIYEGLTERAPLWASREGRGDEAEEMRYLGVEYLEGRLKLPKIKGGKGG